MLSSKNRIIEADGLGLKLQLLDHGWAFELTRKQYFKEGKWFTEYSADQHSGIYHRCQPGRMATSGLGEYHYCGLICNVGGKVPPVHEIFLHCFKCKVKLPETYVRLFQAVSLNYRIQMAR